MSNESELSISELRGKRGELSLPPTDPLDARTGYGDAGPRRLHADWTPPVQTRVMPGATATEPATESSKWAVDPWRFVEALLRKKFWILLGGLGMAGACFALGYFHWTVDTFKVTVQLIRRDIISTTTSSRAGDIYRPQELSETTLQALMVSPAVLRRVSDEAKQTGMRVSERELAVDLAFEKEKNQEIVVINFKGQKGRRATADLANLYASNIVEVTQEMLERDAKEVYDFSTQRVARVEQEIMDANRDLQQFSVSKQVVDTEKETEAYLRQLGEIDLKYETTKIDLETLQLRFIQQNPSSDRLNVARAELENLLTRFTDQHPQVVDQRARIAMIERQMSLLGTNADSTFSGGTNLIDVNLNAQRRYLTRQLEQLEAVKANLQGKLRGISENGVEFARLKGNVQRLEALRSILLTREREAKLFLEKGLNYYSLYQPANEIDVQTISRWPKIGFVSVAGGFLGLLVALGLVLLTELFDTTLKTVDDVRRVIKLPLLATLGDLNKMDGAARNQWAFRTWTLLTGKLNRTRNRGLVCGFISSCHGEGRTTWVELLVAAASQRGFRVLTVSTRDTEAAAQALGETKLETDPSPAPQPAPDGAALAVATGSNILAHPAQITQQLMDPNPQPVVHIPLPGWVWSLERRKQWESALAQWRTVDNLVLLVELPPASQPEAVLLAENLPQVIWLVGSGMADAKETAAQIETLRHARCNLVGAVLNREPEVALKDRIPFRG